MFLFAGNNRFASLLLEADRGLRPTAVEYDDVDCTCMLRYRSKDRCGGVEIAGVVEVPMPILPAPVHRKAPYPDAAELEVDLVADGESR